MLEWLRGYRAYRIWTGTIVLFVVSFVQSCQELELSLWGRTAQATIHRVEPSAYNKRDDIYVGFSFKDADGKSHHVKKTVSERRLPDVAPGQSHDVIYLAAIPDKARFTVERSFVWPAVFFGIIGFVVIWSLMTYTAMQAGRF